MPDKQLKYWCDWSIYGPDSMEIFTFKKITKPAEEDRLIETIEKKSHKKSSGFSLFFETLLQMERYIPGPVAKGSRGAGHPGPAGMLYSPNHPTLPWVLSLARLLFQKRWWAGLTPPDRWHRLSSLRLQFFGA